MPRTLLAYAEKKGVLERGQNPATDFDGDLADEIAALQFRDHHRTGVVTYGELGIADQLIAAITVHTLDETREILETYMPRNTAMAAGADATLSIRAADAKTRKAATS